jgi:hypothetical protein
MDRRRFLTRSGVALGATAGLTGCLGLFGGSAAPPPRESEVFEEIQAQDSALQIQLDNQPMVESRADVSSSLAAPETGGLVAALSPVGVARGAKGGRGATGRGSGGARSAPRSSHGRAKYLGGDYDDWEDEHEDEIERYTPALAAVGIAYLASDDAYADNPPGPGEPPGGWDRTIDNPDPGQQISHDTVREGWYRVGSHLRARNGNHDFGWEAVDFEVDTDGSSPQVDTEWKISPRL